MPPNAPSSLRRRRHQSANPSSSPQSVNNPNTLSDASSHLDPAAKLKTPVVPPTRFTVYQTSLDWLIMLAFTALAAVVRFYRIRHPNVVIFDEVHYLSFNNHILNGTYFFDVNPVWGKLVIAYIAKFLGYDPSYPQVQLGANLPTAYHAFAARAPCALFGTLTVPVFYKVCRWLHLSTYASILGAMFVLFDCMHIIQSRVTMVDSVLVFWTCFSLLCALNLWDQKNYIVFRSKNVTLRSVLTMMFLLVLTGINCGLAIGVRWTAFATPVLIFTISFFGISPFLVQPLNLIELCVLYVSAFLAYSASFALFLINVNKSGPGDGFMSPNFQACLVGNALHSQNTCTMSMWARIWEVNKLIFNYSKSIRGKDKWGSSWFQWIINWRGALYYRMTDSATQSLSIIYVLMNPLMTIIIDILMIVFIGVIFYVVRYRKHSHISEAFKCHLRRGSVLFFGWVCSMLPTMVVYRSGPLYQYLPGLFFAQALAAVGFDFIPRKWRPASLIVLTALLVVGFLYWSPWVYAIEMTIAQHHKRRWLPRWD